MRGWFGGAFAALMLMVTPVHAETSQAAPAAAPLSELVAKVDIPFAQFRLANGLRVVVHTDRKAPLVSVGVWYLVGSRDEPVGQSGFAHLFEHIMFRGSKHSRQDHFQPLEDVGATDLNGTTNFDRTNYYQTVPTPALELALFLESDRMGWLLPALTQDILDSERAIVLNEKRQGENQPGGLVQPALLKSLFPGSHPYSIPAIGQEADLNAATLDDARRWFGTNYGPNNAVLVLAGDIDAESARPLAEKWFGQIPPGPTPARHAAPAALRMETTRQTMADKVATVRLIRAWALPGRDAPGMADLEVGMATLGGGPTSLLFDRLVRQERLAVGVSASVSSWLDAGIASISIEVRPGADPAATEARADALVAEWLAKGPDADEVARVATRIVAGTIRGLERVGGGGGKGAALAEGALLADDPSDYARDLAAIANATPDTVRASARRYLGPGDHRITLLPGDRDPDHISVEQSARTLASAEMPPAAFQPQGQAADREAGAPAAGPATRFSSPAIERARLSNGLAVELVRNTVVPVVAMQLSLPVGVVGDDAEKPGTQRLALALLREGSNGRLGALDGPDIARRAERLGLAFGASASLDQTRLSMNALAVNLPASLALFADIVRHPTFDADQMERVRGQLLASLASEAVNPNGIAMRAAPALIYGPSHPYGRSFSGNGTPEAVAAITRDDLVRFHARQLNPSGGTLFVVGDITMAELLPLLQQALGDWRASERPIKVTVMPSAEPQAAGRIIFYDRPASAQSVILAGAPLPLTGRDDTLALSLANDVFGGGFTARLNRLLREEKGWTYGASSSVSPTRLDMPFLIQAPVEAPRTGESIAAIRSLLADFHGSRPPEAAEVDRARAAMVRSVPGQLETGSAMLGVRERSVALGRPDDYLDTLPMRTEAVTLESVRSAPLPRADDLVFIVVGDRAKVEPQLKELGLPVEHRVIPEPITP